MLETFVIAFKAYAAYFFDELARPAWDNGLYAAPFWCLIFFALEALLPRRYAWPLVGRKGFWLDLFYVLFNDVLVWLLGLFALTYTIEAFVKYTAARLGVPTLTPLDISVLPFWVQLVIVFVLVDFCEWLAHYLLHRFDVLWQFHKIHHSAETLGFASSRRFHVGEYLTFKPLLYIPFAVVNFPAEHYVMMDVTIGTAWGLFTHCNIKMPFGWINYVVNNPETHYWHHAKNWPASFRYGVNFASVLNLWDLLFRCYHAPRDIQPEIGIAGETAPDTFVGQVGWGFSAAFRSLFRRPSAAAAAPVSSKRKRKFVGPR